LVPEVAATIGGADGRMSEASDPLTVEMQKKKLATLIRTHSHGLNFNSGI
jgi:hypothetical protein